MPDRHPAAEKGPTPTGGTALDRSLKVADRLLCWVLVAMMATMLLASVAQVFTRYILETTLIGPEEVARYMMTGATFLAIPVLARRRNHIAVDALAHFLPRGMPQSLLSRGLLLFETLFLAVFAFFAYELLVSVHESGQFSAGLEIPVAWPISALFIGSALGTLMTAGMFVLTFLGPDRQAEVLSAGAGAEATGTTGQDTTPLRPPNGSGG